LLGVGEQTLAVVVVEMVVLGAVVLEAEVLVEAADVAVQVGPRLQAET
jgi:hypothetical protein